LIRNGRRAGVRRAFASFDTRCALGIGLLALALRLAFVLTYGRTQTLNLGVGGVGFPFSDTFFYSWVGSALSMGDGFTFLGHTTAHWPPGYPFLLAGVYWLFGADTANALIANAVIGAMTVPLVYFIGLRTLGRAAAIAAAVALAVMPGQILIGDVALAETFYTFELVGFLALAMSLDRRPRTFVVLGVVAGLAALTRGEGFLFPLIVLGVWAARGGMRRAWRDTAIVAVVMVLTVAPWTIRNAIVVHGFVPVATNASATLWSGHNENANGGPVYHSPAELAALGRLSEVDASARVRDDAIDWAVHHPLRELELIPLKLKALAQGDSEVVWTWINATGAQPLGKSETAVVVRLADAASYALLGALLLTVVVFGRSMWRVPAMRAMLLFLAAAVPLYGLIYYGNVRYRIPLEPFMLLVVSRWAPVLVPYARRAGGRIFSRSASPASAALYGQPRS
jgi:4-amino-4-deoxy-L-arabinose transferase-like glycosyltransferase